MADNELRISQLNRISNNREFNEIVVNSKTTENDAGITKKIKMSDLLYSASVKRDNLENKLISSEKIDDLVVTRDKIANKTVTFNEIENNTIKSELIDTQAVTSRHLKTLDNYVADQFTALSHINSSGSVKGNSLEVQSASVQINGINYNFPNTQVPQYFLKTDGSGNLSWAEAAPGAGTSLTFNEILPVGTILPWTSSVLPADGKWLICNGNTFVGDDYPDLKQFLIDNNQPFGTSTDNINYILPDLRGRTVAGVGSNTDVSGNSETFNLGETEGTYKHPLTEGELPAHKHTIKLSHESGGSHDTEGWPQVDATGPHVEHSKDEADGSRSKRDGAGNPMYSTGSNESHNNIQPTMGLFYIIKAKKDDIVHYNPTIGPGLSSLNGDALQANTLTLSSIEVGIKPNFEDFTFDGSQALSLNENISLSAINFTTDGTMLSSANIGWNYAGDSSNNLPLVYEDSPPKLNEVGLPFDEIDLAPYMRGEARRALVRILAVSSVGAGSSVYFRPKGSYGNIPQLNMRSQAGMTGSGTTGVTLGIDFVKGGINGQKGGIAEVMTDAQGKIEVQSSNGKVLKIYLESYQFFTS